VTYLIHATGNRAMPGAWLSVAAAIALLGVWMSRPAVEKPAVRNTSIAAKVV
jgi:hypothetical protein